MQQTRNHNRDFNEQENRRARYKVWYWLLPLFAVATVMLFPHSKQHSENSVFQTTIQLGDKSLSHSTAISEQPVTKDQPVSDNIATLPVVVTDASSGLSFKPLLEKSPAFWKTITVRKGDTLYFILKRLGLRTATATLVARSDNSAPLVRLSPGRTLHILSLDGSNSDAFIYENSLLTWVYASKNGNSYDISSNKLPTTTHITKVKGEIISSLYTAAKVAGISDTLAMNMTEIFGWDIDFAINVQPGDRFKLIFEDVYVNGSKKIHGDILAAEFINNGKTYRAIANRDDDGTLRYYSPDGRSMQKTFLRTPVKFSRISSRFSKARYHPVLKRTRAHKGVDYAANRGTAVRSTATGRIIHAGRKGGYGNAIIISHGSTYSTLYAHLSSFSRGIKKGSKVKQGQIIGRVGSTGLASGPHLHYEFRINGKHVNPLSFRQPASKPIQVSQKVEFERSARYWEEQLDNIDGLNVAAGAGLSGS